MKNLLLLACLFLSNLAYSQVIVEGVNINEKEDVKICQIVASGKFFSNKVTITIDYGQFVKWGSAKGTKVRDANGKMTTFNSVMGAVNYMENNGWQYLDAYTVSIPTGMGGSQNVYHYTFAKR